MQNSPTRRRVLQTATVGGAFALAGCMGSANEGDDPATTATESPEPTDEEPVDHQSDDEGDGLQEWLATANLPGGRADRRFADEVSVSVGDPRVPYSFRPADLTVSPGTTVVWTWGLQGGPKQVSAVDDGFHSGEPVDEVRHTFEHTFTEPGTYRYVSEPAVDCGMKGVVRVMDVPDTDYPEVARWLADVETFDGTLADGTDADEVSVTVGDPDVNNAFSFTPPAIRIEPGTTVRWEWTGEGGAHDVDFDNADIDTSSLTAEEGATFAYTFETTGVYRYHCRPHRANGQRGAIVVE